MSTVILSQNKKSGLRSRRMISVLLYTLCPLLWMACQSPEEKAEDLANVPVDKTITAANAYTNLYLDSAGIEAFIGANRMAKRDSADMVGFYHSRNYQYAWVDSAGMAEQAFLFMNRLKIYNEEMAAAPIKLIPELDSLQAIYLTDSNAVAPDQKVAERLELLLTWQFFQFARKAFGVSENVDPAALGWFIPAKKIDARSFLDSAILNGGRDFRMHLPVHPLFQKLRSQLRAYTAIQQSGQWQPISFSKKTYQLNDSAAEIKLMKAKLAMVGDLKTADTTPIFTAATREAVMRFESRHGLQADGKADAAVQDALNKPIEAYVQQILLNMERARWVPKPGDGPYIVVNIPSFTLHVYDSGRQQFNMRVVVGTPAHSTVIFNGTLSTVALAPYWNVPYSIVKNEMGRTASYFSKRNMEIVGRYNDGLPMVRQKPGASNALGRVKFLFPNSYSIYLHDTPSKSLFNENRRAFSHGCIRVSDPVRLAYWVLRFNEEWPREKIDDAMKGTKEIQVRVKQPIPVFIGYFTAWEDDEGRMNFRPDIYGHDKKLATHLFAEPQ